jgi:hypothetical protein
MGAAHFMGDEIKFSRAGISLYLAAFSDENTSARSDGVCRRKEMIGPCPLSPSLFFFFSESK